MQEKEILGKRGETPTMVNITTRKVKVGKIAVAVKGRGGINGRDPALPGGTRLCSPGPEAFTLDNWRWSGLNVQPPLKHPPNERLGGPAARRGEKRVQGMLSPGRRYGGRIPTWMARKGHLNPR